MRCPRRLPKMMLAAILAVGIAFPAPALAFADDAADANKSAGESAVDTTAISEGATQTTTLRSSTSLSRAWTTEAFS